MRRSRGRPGRWRFSTATWWRSAMTSSSNSTRPRKPTSEPGKDRRNECGHAGNITARQDKSPEFSMLSELLAGTALLLTDKPKAPNHRGRGRSQLTMVTFAWIRF